MRILRLDGTELCKMLSFARTGEEAVAQVAVEDEEAIGTLATDVLFVDAGGQQFRGAVLGTRVHDSGALVSVALRDD